MIDDQNIWIESSILKKDNEGEIPDISDIQEFTAPTYIYIVLVLPESSELKAFSNFLF